MKRVRPLIFVLSLGCCLIALSIATSKVKAFRKNLPMELVRREALMVDPVALKVVSGEFRGLLADFLLLKAAIIDGGEPDKMTAEDWDAVYMLYKQSLVLDPFFYQTAYYIQGNLVWREGMTRKAMDLLKISADKRTWDWNPLWYLGFDYAHFYNDRIRAADYFLSASKKPDAPPLFGILAARLNQAGGQALTSIAILKAMQEHTDNEEFKKELELRIQAHKGVYQLEQSVGAFQIRFGRLPISLEELVTTGILGRLPINPYSDSDKYYYDPKTGHVDYGSRK